LHAFCELRREFGPVDVPGWVTVVQSPNLVVQPFLSVFSWWQTGEGEYKYLTWCVHFS